MRLPVRPLLALVLLTACSGGEGSDPVAPPPQPTRTPVVLSATSGSPTKVIFVTFPSNRPGGESSIKATLGSDTVDIAVLDSITGVFSVPDVTPGSRQLEIPLASMEIGTGTVQILAAPTIADPVQVVEDRVQEAVQQLDALLAAIEQGALDNVTEAEAAALSAWVAEARESASQLTAEEARQLALWLSANADILQRVSGSSSASGAQLAPDWANWDSFWGSVISQKVAIVENIIACGLLLEVGGLVPAVGVAAVIGCLGILVVQTVNLVDGMIAHYAQPVVATSLELEGAGNLAAAGPRDEGGTAAAATANQFEMDHATSIGLRVISNYRPLNAGDRGIAGDIVGATDDLREKWNNTVRHYVESAPAFPSLFGGSPAWVYPEDGSVHLSGVSGPVACSGFPEGAGVRVECTNTSPSQVGVSLTLTHNSRYASVSTTVSGIVHRNQPAGAVIQGGDGQAIAAGADFAEELIVQFLDATGGPLASYPVSWAVAGGSGDILSADGSTDGSGVARARVRAGSAGGLQIQAIAYDRWGGPHIGTFNLSVEEAFATFTHWVSGVGGSFVTSGTLSDGCPAHSLHCLVSMGYQVEGNTGVQLIGWGFQHHFVRDGSSGSSEVNTGSFSGTLAAPSSGVWLQDEDFWLNQPVGEALVSYTTQHWVDYSVNGVTKRSETSWTCSP